MKKKFKNKTILITGGTGSFGKRMLTHLLKNFEFKKIIIFSRDEQKHHRLLNTLENKQKNKVRFFIGDVRDYERVKLALKNVDFVIHAAAMKHVYLSEYNPHEVIKTNITGTQNVLNAAIENKCKKTILLSSDKAVEPINIYGATKLCAEKIFIAGNNYSGVQDTKFAIVRYGNVIASEGSVIQKFQKEKKIFEVTDKEMTRFWINFDEAIKFVLMALSNFKGAEIYVPKMKNFKIIDLTKAINPKLKVKITGKKPGEKIHETLITEEESKRIKEFNDYFIIYPEENFKLKYSNLKKEAKKTGKTFEYKSNQLLIKDLATIKKIVFPK
jgi:UDP-N-acetylglucosamine 4,6-dehydratase|tara:strand:+ start:116 stop:1099 length:984 start_codon:yes stop_codon:yes gene_type:complete